jgi:hypothetical protein
VAAPAVPTTIGFSARVADNGRPVSGTHAFGFKFFDALEAGTELWKHSATDEPAMLVVNDGVVSYALGSDQAINLGVVFNGLPVFVEVTFNGAVLSPRIQVHSVPYAIRAQVADKLAGPSGGGVNAGSQTLATGDNFFFPTASVTLPSGGRCIVSATVSLRNGATANTTMGPFFRVAVKRGVTNGDDGWYGLYPGPLAPNARASMSRTRTIAVNAGQATAFGCYFGGPEADWVGDSVDCLVDYICF